MAKVCVVLGSVREGRMGERVARMVGEKICCYEQFTIYLQLMSRLSSLGATATLLDPVEVAAPLLQQPLHFLQDQAAAPQWMRDTHDMIQQSDGFMV